MGVANIQRSEHAHRTSVLYILTKPLIYVKFTNFESYIRKVRRFCLFSAVSLSVHPKTVKVVSWLLVKLAKT